MPRAAGAMIPDLGSLDQAGEPVLLPFGGGVLAWAERLAAIGRPELHIYDCEAELRQPPAPDVDDESREISGLVRSWIEKIG